MVAPKEIVDFIESILNIFLYDIRQKERAVFILVDNLVELCCKTRLRERSKRINDQKDLKSILELAKIGGELKRNLLSRRKERNTMQHDLVAVTVSQEHCADSILDLRKLIKKLWGKYSLDGVDEWVSCAFRIIKLYSRSTSKFKRQMFEQNIVKNIDWGLESTMNLDYQRFNGFEIGVNQMKLGKRLPNSDEIILSIKSPEKLVIFVREYTTKVQSILDDLDIFIE